MRIFEFLTAKETLVIFKAILKLEPFVGCKLLFLTHCALRNYES